MGSLWTLSGTLLGRATFANETASGWQQVSFSEPVAVQPGTTYVVSYHAPNGGYAVDLLGVSIDTRLRRCRAIADGVDGGNGVYSYSVEPAFPTATYAGQQLLGRRRLHRRQIDPQCGFEEPSSSWRS